LKGDGQDGFRADGGNTDWNNDCDLELVEREESENLLLSHSAFYVVGVDSEPFPPGSFLFLASS